MQQCSLFCCLHFKLKPYSILKHRSDNAIIKSTYNLVKQVIFMSKTLYISDLDGTLLQSNAKISLRSCDIINSLAEKGMIFSYATARSVHTAKLTTQGLTAKIPLIVYNGAFILQNITCERLYACTFSDSDALQIYSTLTRFGCYPVVYSLINNTEKFSYNISSMNTALAQFLDARKGDFRDRPLPSEDGILDGEKFYFNSIDEDPVQLSLAYSELKNSFNCLLQKDIYGSRYMLEIMPKEATKAQAALKLKKMLGCDRIVGFGDAANDIPLRYAADEFYAVANASEELKALADGVIPSNNDDGVARWLHENYK